MEKEKVFLVFSDLSDENFVIKKLLKTRSLNHWEFISFDNLKEISSNLKPENTVVYIPKTRQCSLYMIKNKKKTPAREILFGDFIREFELKESNVSPKDIEKLEHINIITKLKTELQ